MTQVMANAKFITSMDAAMKAKVSGLYVTDERAQGQQRRVAAYFNRPQAEQRDVTYPYITVNLLSMTRAAEREQRGGSVPIPYAPYGFTLPEGDDYLVSEMPIPYDFTWQIASFARFVEHDREIMLALMQDDRLPPRFGYLEVMGTSRYLDLLDGPTNADGYDDNNVRILRKTWIVRASAEFFQRDIDLSTRPTSVVVGVSATNDNLPHTG